MWKAMSYGAARKLLEDAEERASTAEELLERLVNCYFYDSSEGLLKIMREADRYTESKGRQRSVGKLPLSDLVAKARAAKGQTLEQVARAVGSTKSHMHEIERGANPRLPLLQKLLRHYAISFDEIADA